MSIEIEREYKIMVTGKEAQAVMDLCELGRIVLDRHSEYKHLRHVFTDEDITRRFIDKIFF